MASSRRTAEQFGKHQDRDHLHAAADSGDLDDGAKGYKPHQYQYIDQGQVDNARERAGQAPVAETDQEPFQDGVAEHQQHGRVATHGFDALKERIDEFFHACGTDVPFRTCGVFVAKPVEPAEQAAVEGSGKMAQRQQDQQHHSRQGAAQIAADGEHPGQVLRPRACPSFVPG